MGNNTHPLLEELEVLQGLSRTSAALSIIGSLAVLLSLSRQVRLKHRRLEATDALTIVYLLLLLLFSFAAVFGRAFLSDREPCVGSGCQLPQAGCLLQAGVIHFCMCGITIWVCVGNVMLLLALCSGRSLRPGRPTALSFGVPMLVTVVLSLTRVIALGLGGSFGDASLYCWITNERPVLQLTNFYWPLMGVWILCIVTLIFVRTQVMRRFREAEDRQALSDVVNVNLTRYRRQVTDDALRRVGYYLVTFVVCYFFGMLNQMYTYLSDGGLQGHSFTLSIFSAILLPGHGALVAAVYCGLFDRLLGALRSFYVRRIGMLRAKRSRRSSMFSSVSHGLRRLQGLGASTAQLALTGPGQTVRLGSMQLRIYAATWNVGEAPAPDAGELATWLPPGQDVYAISLQECIHFDQYMSGLSAAACVSGGEYYESYVKKIGSRNTALGYHGYICLVVLTKESLVRSGQWTEVHVASAEVRRGKKVHRKMSSKYRLANKGAVALAFRLHSTTVAFVGCHLTSDSKGRDQEISRHKDAQALLGQMELTYDAAGFELQLSCHHIVVMGDLNYRVSLPLDRALDCLCACDWKQLIQHDQLSIAMANGFVFTGFREALIDFLPSYRKHVVSLICFAAVSSHKRACLLLRRRRVKGQAGYLRPDALQKSSTPLQLLKTAFSLEAPDGSQRVPSYTDRVLFASLPGQADHLRCDRYESFEELLISDHRPVGAYLSLDVQTQPPAVLRGEGSTRCTVDLTNLVLRFDQEQTDYTPLSNDTEPSVKASHSAVDQVGGDSVGDMNSHSPRATTSSFLKGAVHSRKKVDGESPRSTASTLSSKDDATSLHSGCSGAPSDSTQSVIRSSDAAAQSRRVSLTPLSGKPAVLTPAGSMNLDKLPPSTLRETSLGRASMAAHLERAVSVGGELCSSRGREPVRHRSRAFTRCIWPSSVERRACVPSQVIVAFPLPAEDPAFALRRLAWIFGNDYFVSGRSQYSVPWTSAITEGIRRTSEIVLAATSAVHMLLKVVDSEDGSVGMCVLPVEVPQLEKVLSQGARHHNEPQHFEAILTVSGRRVGVLSGDMCTQWHLAPKVGLLKRASSAAGSLGMGEAKRSFLLPDSRRGSVTPSLRKFLQRIRRQDTSLSNDASSQKIDECKAVTYDEGSL
ncbi:hypothetical protein AB1Y20_020466 [Prymnesium parvum]|uniref:G-protein coupled receptors family 2 profile 2 domain-containing protein n=1 Tax=Prymnesium parvum TaxID=97485 RepID=A0AB34JX74_PRYPA